MNIEPGQIWLIEQYSGSGLCSLDRAAVAGARFVLYDRPLALLVTETLPVGGYAEPLPSHNERGCGAVCRRAVEFAADGWAVVQLTEPSRGWRGRVRDTAEQLGRFSADGDAPVTVFAKSPATDARRRDGRLSRLGELLDDFPADEPLTLVLGPVATGLSGEPRAFTANGLAG